MSLSRKILLILFVFVLLFVGASFVVQRLVVYPSFDRLERDEAREDLRRVVQALWAEISHLDGLCHDWSAWDDTYEYVVAPNPDYERAALVESSFLGNGLNLIALYNTEGERVWSQVLDLDTLQPIPTVAFSASRLPTDHPLLRYETTGRSLNEIHVAGLYMSELGPMLIASRPIVTSRHEGPIHGSILMGRLVTDDVLGDLLERTEVSFVAWPAGDDTIPVDAGPYLAAARRPGLYVVDARPDELAVYATVSGIQGEPVLFLRADVPRDITARGAHALSFGLLSIVAAGLTLLLLLLLLLQGTVLQPLARLTDHAIKVGSRDDLLARISMRRRDEIGSLATEFDRMVQRLADARKRLLEQSYYSGMAEMASGVLHNVRNALAPLAVELDELRDQLDRAGVADLEQAHQELSDPETSADRRRDLERFVGLSSLRLGRTAQTVGRGMDGLLARVQQIETILAAHDRIPGTAQPVERVRVAELAQEAITMLPASIRQGTEIRVGAELDRLEPFGAHRIQLMQVLINLVTNAVEATLQRGGDGLVEVDGRIEADDGARQLHLTVQDNGTGMTEEDLRRLFERGFSTKPNGHSGLGLHWCANTVRAMNGRIWAENVSHPAGGARFHVTLPTAVTTAG